MTTVFAVALAALALAPVAALRFARLGAGISGIGCVLLAIVGIDAALGGARPVLDLGPWLGFGDSALRADGLAGLFLALTGVTGAAVSAAYVELPASRYLTVLHGTLLLFVATAIGSDNGFLFLLAWEALAVCIYLLASADTENPGAVAAGYFTAGLTKVGGAALLAAFGLLYGKTGSFALADWANEAAGLSAGTRDVLFVLFVIAFGTKVGVLPLQGALPVGYGAAPRGGAATISVALAAGFYGLWRFVFELIGPAVAWWGDALLVLGAVTAVAGVTYAITQDDLRRFLGFSTIEHTGITFMGLGLALLGQAEGNRTLAAAGLLAGTLHLIAHALAKCLALVAVDRIQQATGERTLDPLGGLARLRPTALAFGVASFTLAAIPPLGGFVSEWFTFEALLQSFRLDSLLARVLGALAAAALALTAGLGLLAFAKLYGFVFLGVARSRAAEAREATRGVLSVAAPGAVLLFLGTVAPWEVHLLGAGLADSLGFDPAPATISHPLVLGPVFRDFSVLAPTWLTVVLPAYAIAGLLVAWSLRRSPARRAPVWVTGSGADVVAVQYRPSSYSNPIRVVLRGPLGFRSALREETEGGAAGTLLLQTRVIDATERFLYRPLARAALAAAARVRRLQSGRLGDYLLYMLAVLILVLVLTPVLR